MFFREPAKSPSDPYFVYHFRGRPVVAVPVSDERLRRAGISRYPIYSFKRRIFRKVLQVAIFLRLDRFWSRKSALPAEFIGDLDFSALVEHFQKTLGQENLFPVIHRPPQVGRERLYIHLLNQSGEAVAFVKLALDQTNNEQLAREGKSLSHFRSRPPVGFAVPSLLGDGEFRGHRYILLSALPNGVRPVSDNWETLKDHLQELAGAPVFLKPNQIRQTHWWKRYFDERESASEEFNAECARWISRGSWVGRVHGDLGVHNLARADGKLWVIDWEESSEVGPRRTDEIGHYLSTRQRHILRNPEAETRRFTQVFIHGATEEDRHDVIAALIFLYATGRHSARKIARFWPEIPAEKGVSRLATRQGMALDSGAKQNVAIISNEPTPYRVHVLNRLADELPEVRIHNIFTHTLSKPSMPWDMSIGSNLHPVFFPDQHLEMNRPLSVRSAPLFRKIRNYLLDRDVRFIVLLGYNDLTRLLLIRWARKRKIPVLLAGDSNVFADGRVGGLTRLVKRRYIRWVLSSISGLMPMGTCGRAFFRSYCDHELPEFLFPYEPDYGALDRIDHGRLDNFLAKHDLQPTRKRFLVCGRLVDVKRVDIAVDAFVRKAPYLPDWDLVIAGDGPLRGTLLERIPLDLRHRVKFLGFLQFGDTALCYRACHVLVHTSEFEPWGLVINEAVASGLAVIATAVTGAAVELVRHRLNGLIISPRSVEALTIAMDEIAQRGTYERMRSAAPAVLKAWRIAADPVQGFRESLGYFGILPAADPAISADSDPVESFTRPRPIPVGVSS
jgi:glycosyltransferase involved in cell wall biosynthesis